MKRKSSIAIRAFQVLRKEGTIVFLWKALAYIKLEPLILPYAFLRIKRLNGNGLANLVDFCFYGIGGLIKPLQVRNEILELLRILHEIEPDVVIEIGTAGGGTLFLFSRVASEHATMISIDFPDRKFRWRIPLYRASSLPRQQLHLIRADSHTQETLERVKTILNGRKVHFLFIDGDHTYEGVRRDFEMYSPLVKEGGIIAFHDVVVHVAETSCEVSKLWNEIKKEKYHCAEIVNDRSQNWGGIGLLFMNSKRS